MAAVQNLCFLNFSAIWYQSWCGKPCNGRECATQVSVSLKLNSGCLTTPCPPHLVGCSLYCSQQQWLFTRKLPMLKRKQIFSITQPRWTLLLPWGKCSAFGYFFHWFYFLSPTEDREAISQNNEHFVSWSFRLLHLSWKVRQPIMNRAQIQCWWKWGKNWMWAGLKFGSKNSVNKSPTLNSLEFWNVYDDIK